MPIPRPALAPVPMARLYRCGMGEAFAVDGRAVSMTDSSRTDAEENDMSGEGKVVERVEKGRIKRLEAMVGSRPAIE